jgi:hypothetical protein
MASADPARPRHLLLWRYTVSRRHILNKTNASKGVNGLTARDIKLITDAGFNTVESVAYTYGSLYRLLIKVCADSITVLEDIWSR